ncbi:NAD(P)H-hydrate dehydratase [Thiomicrorhabdus sp. zzn3]|uniref:NAD(P)H-hydrate dehydratase n=1 Tax=Thiomicrorhabdus sp. zzn3 TaxID=3039775 RepID=UPI002436617D|nr:NAD(P)H-hydrate dehydratase [Thiomicrorhabdus sp. zzn3]MDG6777223.1 NAD(P)H-hydrate dehydratase [Thiomicrorhabdus sp. zzn3]
MMRFHTAEQSRAIDRFAIESAGIPGLLLMKRAGLYAFETLRHHYPKAQRLLIVCGGGNNGGDGFVVAQLAAMAGFQVDLTLLGSTDSLHNEARQAFDELKPLKIAPVDFTPERLEQCDLVIDALFGTGLDRPVSGIAADWIQQINLSNKPVLAIDIPSGLHADSGQVMGQAIRADRTCTFITRKLGLYQFQGPDHCGQIHYSPLFLAQEILQSQTSIATNHSLKHWLNLLPLRPQTSHKGRCGSVALVGGDRSMMGAIQMAGLASLKVGVGLVKVITHAEHGIALTQTLPELMCYTPEELKPILVNTQAVGLGPGLGLNEWGKTLFDQACSVCMAQQTPLVMDADALKLLAKTPQKYDRWILTPHPGEAAALLDCTTADIQQDRVAAVKALHARYGGVIVLKGNGTLIYDGEKMELCTAGNPGMAVGGMGDVLTGTISGLLAQGMALFNAACLGVSLHAHAGDLLARQHGQPGLLPTELAATLSQLLTYAEPQVKG